ncbi:MAG TPA: carboxypeptidase-like regulatory domain-containing protein [Bryobacteraceae bacterium]|jgi:hypothetical protein
MRSALICFFLSAATALPQTQGTIAGTVTDTFGAKLANAAIQAKNADTGAVFKTGSSQSGEYALAQLPPGGYDILALAPGMKPFQSHLPLKAGESARLDIRIEDFANLNTLGDGRDLIIELTSRHSTPTGSAPRTSDGKPDFSGVWRGSLPSDPGRPELLPAALAIFKERTANQLKDFPMGRCQPTGVTMFGTFLPYRVLQTPGYLAMISEADTPNYRQIFLDGRPHPANLEPTWMGHSIGHWDGDTLVVDTVGFNGKTWIDVNGLPYTENTHITERYRRPDLGHLEIEYTVEDSTAYAKPWTIKRVSELDPGEEVGEYICTENNKDLEHLVGK